ncbi:MAG: hypothetical protein PHV39_03885, partial [Methanomicrobium sp.]|nr:hypothetical protein [Methanomicrobium sp.]
DIKDAIGNDYSPGYPVIDEVIVSVYHDRVAAGWEEYTGGTKKLKIYDPANGGSIYTESFVENHPFAAFTYP